jgi:taurine dioxygenase
VLFVNAYTTHFTNFHTAENVRFGQDYTSAGRDLLGYLIEQAAIPEFQVRFRWKPNSMAMWDNRSTQHYAAFDYPGQFRHLQRVTVLDTEPWPGTRL